VNDRMKTKYAEIEEAMTKSRNAVDDLKDIENRLKKYFDEKDKEVACIFDIVRQRIIEHQAELWRKQEELDEFRRR